MVLPLLGGTPAVWNTCMVFFQAALLAGYAYAHATTRPARRPPPGGRCTSGCSLLPLRRPADRACPRTGSAAAAGDEPGRVAARAADRRRRPAVLRGLDDRPAAAALVRRDGHPAAADPYFLYARATSAAWSPCSATRSLVEPNLPLRRPEPALGRRLRRASSSLIAGVRGDRSGARRRAVRDGRRRRGRRRRRRSPGPGAAGCAGSAWRSCRRA